MLGTSIIATTGLGKVAKSLTTTTALISAVERNEVEPLFLASLPSKMDLNSIKNTEYAGLMTGCLIGYEKLENFLVSNEVINEWNTFKEHISSLAKAGEIEAFKVVSKLGLTENIFSAIVPEHLRASFTEWKQLGVDKPLLEKNFTASLKKQLNQVFGTGKDIEKKQSIIAVPLNKLADFEQTVLKWSDDKGILFTAKRIDYVFGSQYVQGINAKLPLLGSFLNVMDKSMLGGEISKTEWTKLGIDAFAIVTIIAAPYMLPAAGATISANFAIQTAIRGAAIGALNGGVSNGFMTLASTGDHLAALTAAGKGMVIGSALGGVAGWATGGMLSTLVDSTIVTVLPKVTQPYAMGGITGATVGSIHGGITSSIIGYQQGGLEGALASLPKGVVGGASTGAAAGVAMVATGKLIDGIKGFTWAKNRSTYWKEIAKTATTEAHSSTNIDRLNAGKPPQGFNPITGKLESWEVHHRYIPQRSGLPRAFIDQPWNLIGMPAHEHRAIHASRA